MYYSVVHYPDIDTTKIEDLRRKYDPTSGLIKAHFTLVFPVNTDLVTEDELVDHIQKVTRHHKAFRAKVLGFEKSWDNWLFLGLEDGKDEAVALHDELYSGLLESHWRKDIPFSPHISLGQFNQEGSNYSLKSPEAVPFNDEKYTLALKEAKEAGLVYETSIDKVTLIKLNDDFTEILETRDFDLSK